MNREIQTSVGGSDLRDMSCPWSWFMGNTDLIIGIVLYALTAYLDAFYTIYGLTLGTFQEGNPIPKFFMNLLGIKKGLIFVKGSVFILLLLVCSSIRGGRASRFIRCLPFYVISIFQVLAVAAWLLCLNLHPLDIRLAILP